MMIDQTGICPVDGTSAIEAMEENGRIIQTGKKKSRRKNKRNAVTYDKEQEKTAPIILESKEERPLEALLEENDDGSTELPAELPLEFPSAGTKEQPTEKPDPPSTEPPLKLRRRDADPEQQLGEGLRTDAMGRNSAAAQLPDDSGIIYEIAEELYRRERTLADLEALCQPPFHKVFTEGQTESLDRQAHERTEQLLTAAGASVREPAFLPDGIIEPNEKPIGTSSAFLFQILLMIPLVNVIAAIFLAFGRNTNLNLRAYSRGFIILTVIFMTGLLVYFGIFYFTSPFGRSQLERFNIFQ